LVQEEGTKRATFADIAQMIGRANVVQTSVPRRSSLRSAPFTGRAEELNQLGVAFRTSRQRPVIAVVRGESGIGKSALLREFCQGVLEPAGTFVLSGRCYERESVPYKAFDALAEELGRHLSSVPGEPMLGLGSDEAAALLHVFPVLQRVEWLYRRASGA